MAVKGSREFDIDADPAAVMAAVAAVEERPRWSGPVKSVTVETRYDDGRPKRIRADVTAVGIGDVEVSEFDWDGDEFVQWKLIESGQQAEQIGSYRLTPTDKGTHVVFDLELSLKVKLPGFMQRRVLDMAMNTGSKDFAKYVEGRR